ncbi:MAG TPA: hypothetical protein VKS25_00950, partial [Solirubrobacteraceae bacterium]|nr:hypothetical protein [Solirubrobacteraceae bacterium]
MCWPAARGRRRGPYQATTAVLPPILQILADGGPQTGFGHLGRCLAIAEELGDGATYFTVADEAAAEFVRRHGGRVGGEPAAVVLIDRRAPTDAVEVAALHADGCRVVLLDDAGSGRDTADLVIDPPTAVAWPPTRTPRLGGFEHVLLRRAVRAAAATASPDQAVLLTLGGSDPTGATPALADALTDAGIDVRVAIGPGYRGERPRSGTIVDTPEQFIAALAASQLLVSSYGHTLLEAAHLGIPAIVVAALPEHRDDAAAFCANGTAVLCEMSAGPPELVALVRELLADGDRRAALAARGRELVDGRGAERVAAATRELAAPAGHAGPVVARNVGWDAIDCAAC